MGIDAGAAEVLDREAYISLATFRRSGKAVETPVWFAGRDGKFYVFTEAKSGKVKRLRNDNRIRVAPCSVRGRIRGDWTDGHGRRIEDASIESAAYDVLRAKYGWQMRLLDFFSRRAGRIEGRAILELQL